MRLRKIFVLLLPWVLSTNVRYVFGQPQEFGAQQYLEYTRFILPASAIMLLVGIFLFYKKPNTASKPWKKYLVLVMAGLLLASTAASVNTGLSIYWVALSSVFGFGTYYIAIALNADPALRRLLLGSLSIAVLLQAMLGIYQITFGHSLGIPFLGEPIATDATVGVAKLIINGQRILRPFGTFSHSNIYAGFLVIGILATIYFYWSSIMRSARRHTVQNLHVGITLFALLVSYSRTAWAAATAGIIILSSTLRGTWSVMKVPLAVIVVALLVGLPGILGRFQLHQQTSQLEIRADSTNQAKNAIFLHPILGSGPHTFVFAELSLQSPEHPKAPHLIQPVHNLILLIAAEFGLPLAALMLFYFGIQFLRVDALGKSVLAATLIIACLDHYLLTTSSGAGILVLALLMCKRRVLSRATSQAQ